MPLILKSDDTVLFYGDSITDCGRDRASLASLGDGYVKLLADRLSRVFPGSRLRVLNQGVSGDRIYDLEARLDRDVLAHRPSVVTVLIGVNDTWRRYDSNLPSPLPDFRRSYRAVLTRLVDQLGARLVLMEPFLLPVPEGRRTWREDLDPKIAVVRELAAEFAADLIPLDTIFARAAEQAPASSWLPDGVHPSPNGHALVADAWLANAGLAAASQPSAVPAG
ncbi:MAG TPA: SGNH/GDSL hydrolase family protein [Opitutaceae bacterium]